MKMRRAARVEQPPLGAQVACARAATGLGWESEETTADGKTIHQTITIHSVRWSFDTVSRSCRS